MSVEKKFPLHAASKQVSAGNAFNFEELMDEFRNLALENASLVTNAFELLEAQWHGSHTHIFPQFCMWKESLGLKTYSTFDYKDGLMVFKPLLSDASSIQFESVFSKNSEGAVLEHAFGNNIFASIDLAVASQEMQIEFENNLLIVPIVFYEKTCGIIIAKAKNIDTSQYVAVSEATCNMLSSIRAHFFSNKQVLFNNIKNAG